MKHKFEFIPFVRMSNLEIEAEKRRKLGHEGEDEACIYLESNGYMILSRNYRVGKNEIDIIASDDTHVVFVEVKTRTAKAYAPAAGAVNLKKRKGLIRAAKAFFVSDGRAADKFPRFDVIEIYRGDNLNVNLEINHIRNAFDASGSVIL